MRNNLNRQDFIMTSSPDAFGLGNSGKILSLNPLRIPEVLMPGILGLDTSHNITFIKTFNNPAAGPGLVQLRIDSVFSGATATLSKVLAGFKAVLKIFRKLELSLSTQLKN